MFSRWRARAEGGLETTELQRRLATVERALELRIHDRAQAEVDHIASQAAAVLLDSLAEVTSACLTVGSLVIVKFDKGGSSVVLAHTLSPAEMLALHTYPELRMHPDKFFDALAAAVSGLDRGPTEPI
jgi:S-adenosylmethionine/arginine decarboxylase-like enzyme